MIYPDKNYNILKKWCIRILPFNRKYFDYYIERIESLLGRGRFAQVIRTCEKILNANVNTYERSVCYHRIGIAYGFQGDYNEATNYLKKALDEISDEIESEINMHQKASIYFHLGRSSMDEQDRISYYNKSIAYYNKLQSMHSLNLDNCEILLSMAAMYKDLDNYDEAAHCFRVCYETCGSAYERATSMLGIGNIEYMSGNYEKAEKAYLTALGIKEQLSRSEIYLGLGKAQYELGRLDEAEKSVLSAIKYKYYNPYLKGDYLYDIQINYWMGILTYKTKRYLAAIEYFNKAMENMAGNHHDYNSGLIYLGHCYLALKEFSKANEIYKKVLESDIATESEKDIAKYSIQRTSIFEHKWEMKR